MRREAIAALVAVLEDDKRKIEVASLSVYSIVPSAVLTASIPPSRKAASGKKSHEGSYIHGCRIIPRKCQVPVSAIVGHKA